MLLHGSIQRFGLVGILQFLAQYDATGVLEIRDSEEYGFVYLVNGRVEGISLPITDDKLGIYLIRAGCLTEQQLAEALVEDSLLTRDRRRQKPLGQRLVERGFVTEDEIREAVNNRTREQVFELAHWKCGAFRYDEPESMPHFQVKIEGDVQGLLLDAQRRIDEGEHARKAGQVEDDDICLVCPLADECSATIKAKHRARATCPRSETSTR